MDEHTDSGEIAVQPPPNKKFGEKLGHQWSNRHTELAELARLDIGDATPHEDFKTQQIALETLADIKELYGAYIAPETWKRVDELEKRLIHVDDTDYIRFLDLVDFFGGNEPITDSETLAYIAEKKAEEHSIGGNSDMKNRQIVLELKPQELDFWWEDIDEDEKKTILAKTNGNEEQAKSLYIDSLKKGIVIHEIVHQFQNPDLNQEISECAARYYEDAILQHQGLLSVSLSDLDPSRIDFYRDLLKKYGEGPVSFTHFGNFSQMEPGMTDILNDAVTPTVSDQLFPDGEDL